LCRLWLPLAGQPGVSEKERKRATERGGERHTDTDRDRNTDTDTDHRDSDRKFSRLGWQD
jgi:hypothetical protein